MHPLPQTGVLTFLFTDIEGSTTRWDRTPEKMAAALATHDAVLSETIAAQDGIVFKRVGDAFCCVFPSPVKAAIASVDIQRRLASQAWDRAIGDLRVRVGIHTGSALSSDDDYFGPTLNRVARLMSAGHGGQVLLSAATAALVRGELPPDFECRSLGTNRLRDLAEPETIFQLHAVGLQKDFPALRTLDARPNNLPIDLSSFVGRETELQELRDLVARHRLITLCGPGGIGKTRLALQLGAELLEDFEDGVWFVRLAPTSDPSLIVQTIAAALDAGEAAGESIESTLLRDLGFKHALLVLDNAEHLMPAIAGTVKTILDRAKDVRIFTTSRESLHVRGEQIYRIGPVADAAATRLFVERAQAAVHDFAPAADDSDDLNSIAHALQGIPLAIELSAARIATFSLHQIRERLNTQLAFLRSAAAEDSRHATLRQTIAWSYELLDGGERKLLSALAIFIDGFTLEACEAIADEPAALDTLDALVDKSFLVVERGAAEARYRMLDIIREYACERGDPALMENARDVHFTIFTALAKKRKTTLPHGQLVDWLNAVDSDIANVRAALTYGFEKKRAELGEMLLGLFRYWLIRRTVKEGRAWLQRYIDAASDSTPKLAGILRRATTFASIEGDYEQADALAKRSLTLYHAAKDETGVLEALHALAVNENRHGNYTGAEKLYADIAARCTEAGQERGAVTSAANCAAIKLQRGDIAAAETLLSACLASAKHLGDEEIYAGVIALHGTLAYNRAQWQRADEYFSEALAIREQLKNDFGIAEITAAIATVRAEQDRMDEACDLAAKSLETALRLDALELVVNSLEACALVALRKDALELAEDAFALSEAIRRIHSLNERVALGLQTLERDLRGRAGRTLEDAIDKKMSGDWKAAALEIARQLKRICEISAT